MRQVYHRVIKNPAALNRYQGFSDEVYGEAQHPLISELIKMVPPLAIALVLYHICSLPHLFSTISVVSAIFVVSATALVTGSLGGALPLHWSLGVACRCQSRRRWCSWTWAPGLGKL